MLTWFRKTRQTHSKIGYWMHLAGQWIAVAMMIYFWRAIIHLLDTVEAFAGAWQYSNSEHFGFVDGLVAIPMHLISEPIYFLQLTLIVIVLHLTVNRTGYRGSTYIPYKPNHGGIAIFAAMTLFR